MPVQRWRSGPIDDTLVSQRTSTKVVLHESSPTFTGVCHPRIALVLFFFDVVSELGVADAIRRTSSRLSNSNRVKLN